MNKIQLLRKSISFLIIIILFFSCKKSDVTENKDPSNLVMEVTLSATETGKVFIQAHGDNVSEYKLYIDNSAIPEASNTSGTFEYLFTSQGVHLISVRAYGQSGLYIKAEKQIELGSNEVSVDSGYFSQQNYPGMHLVWSDEFNGATIDESNWTFESGAGGWGNSELQFYKKENAWVNEGTLVIEARKENWQNSSYTSARMITRNKHSFLYGRIDIRALLPIGQGMWPALWMLGNNLSTVGWPACGETDIMEMIGGSGRENTVYGTLHWDNNGHVQAGGNYKLPINNFGSEYHVFSIIWDETSIKWLMNDTQFYVIDITPAHMSEFHQAAFFIFNIAVGGVWPGNPNSSTVFPQQMKVDYIRVFQPD
ncbi:MAG: family 16 glycosylhydrolase [Omnitrophica WOR_2 bacterium]